MPDQCASAVYHLAQPGQLLQGELVHIEDSPDATANIYLNRFHIRDTLVWDFNWITRHQVGNGLWQQRWSNDGRMQDPPHDLGIAISRWELVPTADMPRGRNLFAVSSHGSCIWLIRSGQCTQAMCDVMNEKLRRIAGDGLWMQRWYEPNEHPPTPLPGPTLRSPAALIR